MRPRKTKTTTVCLTLPGGNEDNFLYAEKTSDEDGKPIWATFWEVSEEEQKAIVAGGRIVLFVWGEGHPPVAMNVLAPE